MGFCLFGATGWLEAGFMQASSFEASLSRLEVVTGLYGLRQAFEATGLLLFKLSRFERLMVVYSL